MVLCYGFIGRKIRTTQLVVECNVTQHLSIHDCVEQMSDTSAAAEEEERRSSSLGLYLLSGVEQQCLEAENECDTLIG